MTDMIRPLSLYLFEYGIIQKGPVPDAIAQQEIGTKRKKIVQETAIKDFAL
jgi:hypothetical protein